MDTTKGRLHYIDVFRGLCMLLVVLGHAIFDIDNPVNNFFQSFRMPIFYFISGLFFRSIGERGTSWHDIFVRKGKGLLYPYLTLSVCGTLLYWFVERPLGWDLNVTVQQSLLGLLWDDAGVYGIPVTQGFWFVYDLLWISFVYPLLRCFDKRGWLTMLGSLLIAVMCYYSPYTWYLQSIMIRISCGMFFFALGNMFYRHLLDCTTAAMSHHTVLTAVSVCVGICVLGILSRLNGTVVMQISLYGNFFLFLIAAIIGISVVFAISYAIQDNRLLEYVGETSLLILFYHFFVLHALHVIAHYFVPTMDNFAFPIYLIHFVLAVIVSVILAWLTNRYIPFIWKWPFIKEKRK